MKKPKQPNLVQKKQSCAINEYAKEPQSVTSTCTSKATIIKTAYHWHKNRQINQWHRINDSIINSHIYGYLVFDEEYRNTH